MGFLVGADRRDSQLAEDAGDGDVLAGGDQVLLRPDDQVALAAALQQRVGEVLAVAGDRPRGAGGAERAPLPAGRLLPVPPAGRQAAVAGGEAAEELQRAGAGGFVGLADGVDRVAPEPVVEVGVLVDGPDRGPDRLPVHLRLVVGGAARPEEDRVGEGRVVVDVGEAGEGEREGFADARRAGCGCSGRRRRTCLRTRSRRRSPGSRRPFRPRRRRPGPRRRGCRRRRIARRRRRARRDAGPAPGRC